MNKETTNTIVERITNLLKSKTYINFAYIFGSFASNVHNSVLTEPTPSHDKSFNDIDIAIYILDDKLESFFSIELEIEDELESIINIPIDVRIINSAPLSFQYNVIKTGFVVIDNNKNFRADFECLIIKKYFDFVHIRNEYLKDIINAPV